MRNRTILISLTTAALIIAGFAAWTLSERGGTSEPVAYTAPGMGPMEPEMARDAMFTLLPSLLLVVYQAFSETEEAAIYDTLAEAAGGEALEALYLERAGAMVGGGLTEQDQTIHEMRLIKANSRQTGETFALDAEWQVIGTVGHSEHLHVRGNIYRADLVIAPQDGAWKITGFELIGVDRQAAGEMFEAEGS